jgi:hypothetical protein
VMITTARAIMSHTLLGEVERIWLGFKRRCLSLCHSASCESKDVDILVLIAIRTILLVLNFLMEPKDLILPFETQSVACGDD